MNKGGCDIKRSRTARSSYTPSPIFLTYIHAGEQIRNRFGSARVKIFSRRRHSNVISNMNLIFMLSCMMMILWLFCGRCKAAPGLTHHTTITNHHPHLRGYAMKGLMKDLVEDLVGEDDDNLRLSKREQLDTEYGHWRFGKRSNDDEEYGHSRFGRNID